MKLRNKKTGEIGLVHCDATMFATKIGVFVGNDIKLNAPYKEYNSLAELNTEWEDYEDELLYVISAEHKSGYQCVLKEEYPEICKAAKELGIGFETEKECQKAVGKLKAWKRLNEKGFRITLHNCKGDAWLEANWGNLQGDHSDVLLLFGGENE